MKIHPLLMVAFSILLRSLVLATHKRRRMPISHHNSCTSTDDPHSNESVDEQEEGVTYRTLYLKRSIDTARIRLKCIAGKLSWFGLSEDDLEDPSKIHAFSEARTHHFFHDLKESGLYPGLSDKTRTRREEEQHRILSMSPKQFICDYTELCSGMIRHRNNCLNELYVQRDTLCEFQDRKTTMEERINRYLAKGTLSSSIHKYQYALRNITYSMEACRTTLTNYCDSFNEYSRIIAHRHNTIDTKLPMLPMILGKNSIRALYRSYIDTKKSLDDKVSYLENIAIAPEDAG